MFLQGTFNAISPSFRGHTYGSFMVMEKWEVLIAAEEKLFINNSNLVHSKFLINKVARFNHQSALQQIYLSNNLDFDKSTSEVQISMMMSVQVVRKTGANQDSSSSSPNVDDEPLITVILSFNGPLNVI
jgi:hypothetical protein